MNSKDLVQLPSGQMTLTQRHVNIDAINATLYKRRVPAG